MDFEVEILLAIYNGENCVEELLDSLKKQTFKNWRIVVSDDGSTDTGAFATWGIEKEKRDRNADPSFRGNTVGALHEFWTIAHP